MPSMKCLAPDLDFEEFNCERFILAADLDFDKWHQTGII
jgi:hypothetical protein